MSIQSVMPSNHLILGCSLLLPPSIFPSIRVFSNESVLRIRWPKYWSFSFGISPSNEYSGLISFRMDWVDLLAVQGTLKSLLQHHSSKASILRCSAFFIVQLTHPHMTTGKTIALTRRTIWIWGDKIQHTTPPRHFGNMLDGRKELPGPRPWGEKEMKRSNHVGFLLSVPLKVPHPRWPPHHPGGPGLVTENS